MSKVFNDEFQKAIRAQEYNPYYTQHLEPNNPNYVKDFEYTLKDLLPGIRSTGIQNTGRQMYYGNRMDGSYKDDGFLGNVGYMAGLVKQPMGEVAEGVNISHPITGKRIEVLSPSINPYMTPEQLNYMQKRDENEYINNGFVKNKDIEDNITYNTEKWASDRYKQGLSPFMTEKERTMGVDLYYPQLVGLAKNQ